MGEPLHIRNKTYEYRSSLRKLIRGLRISFTNENVGKKLKILVAFLSNQKSEGNWASSPAPFFSKSFHQNYEKAI